MNNSSVQLNYPKQKRELVTPSLISICSKRWSKTHLNGSRCTQRFSSHLWRIGGCFPAHAVQQSLIQQEIKCHEASVIHCVTVTGCPPVSVLQSNRMRGNYSHVHRRIFYLTETFTPLFTQMLWHLHKTRTLFCMRIVVFSQHKDVNFRSQVKMARVE